MRVTKLWISLPGTWRVPSTWHMGYQGFVDNTRDTIDYHRALEQDSRCRRRCASMDSLAREALAFSSKNRGEDVGGTDAAMGLTRSVILPVSRALSSDERRRQGMAWGSEANDLQMGSAHGVRR